MRLTRHMAEWAILAATLFTAAAPQTALATDPVANPYLSAPKYAITHFDSAQTDAFPYAVAQGTGNTVSTLAVPQVVAGPINIMTLASTDANHMWGVSTSGVSYINVANGHFSAIGRLSPTLSSAVQGLLLSVLDNPLNPLNTLAAIQSAVTTLGLGGSGTAFGGVYTMVDNNNVLYVVYGSTVYAIGVTVTSLLGIETATLQVLRTLDTTTFLASGESPQGVAMTYDGHMVILGSHSVSVVDRNFSTPVQTVSIGAGESITNSAAVDENNGIYVVSDQRMYKLVWTGTTLSQNAADGAWVSTYPAAGSFPTLFGKGSGSTPTLMGFGSDPDKLVVITDGSNRMNLMAFWRNAVPAGSSQIAGQIPVTCGLPLSTTYIQSDQSVSVNGYGAFVVNDVASGSLTGNVLVDSLARGPVLPSPVGAERFQWDPVGHAWSSVWTRPDVATNSMVPAVSSASNIVFVNGYYTATGWEVTGMDWSSGQTVYRTRFGFGVLGDGSYSLIQFLPNGDLLFNSIIGPTRIQPGGTLAPL